MAWGAVANDRMRRIALALLSAFLLCMPAGVIAQLVVLKIVAPSPPGSGWDQIAHALRSALAENMPASAIDVYNVPGGNGLVGMTQFVSNQIDGDLMITGLTMLDASVVTRASSAFDGLVPIARLSTEPFAIVVPAASPMKNLADLRAALRADPARVTWAGGPIGGVDQVAAILLGRAFGVDATLLNYVPFLTSAEGGGAAAEEKVAAAILAYGEVQHEISAGRVRLLAVTAPERVAGVDAPTLIEAGIPLEIANWRGVVGKPGMTRLDQMRLASLTGRIVASPTWHSFLERKRWRHAYLPADEFGDYVRAEHARLKDALKAAGLLRREPE